MSAQDTGLFAERVPHGMDEEAARHSLRLQALLLAELRAAGGWISFERYMDAVLYTPGLGYYSAGARKLGPGGDFTTAPEISTLFGACLGRQCAEVLEQLGGGSILEIGAGSGALAADVLECLDRLGQLPERYRMLDISADLRERQRQTLERRVPHLLSRVEWPQTPSLAPFDGVVLANEVLDALPVSRFRWHRTHCEELGVGEESDRLVWAARPAGEALGEECRSLAAGAGGWKDGYVSELCPRLVPWSAEVTRPLRRGLVLWIDYGLPRRHYYLPERRDGTLLCHFRQQAHDDPFAHPGLEDITAWVDFTRLAEASRAAHCTLAGFCTQAHLLAALGVDEEMRVRAAGDAGRLARLANEARRLMLPGEMGERFKAMAWLRALDAPLRGFSLQDLRHTL